jgi:hypothetical protein
VERLGKGLEGESINGSCGQSAFPYGQNTAGLCTWKTRRLSEETLAMREAFQNAKVSRAVSLRGIARRTELCLPFPKPNIPKQRSRAFFTALNDSLSTLSTATSTAIDTGRDILLESCGFEHGADQWPSMRAAAVSLEPAVTDPRLLTFLKRVTQNGADSAGIESVLALVANRPPQNWSDTDVDRFPEAATAIGKAFRTAARSTGVASNGRFTACRSAPDASGGKPNRSLSA